MTDAINTLLDFVSFTHEIRKVKRAMWVIGEEQYENDSEHSFQLALIALYIIEQNRLPLDPFRTMAMAVVHDILEVHSGDTHVFGDQSALSSKQARETAAIAKLKEDWPQLQLMHELIAEYEHKDTAESKFVYALDKLVPMCNNVLDNGRNWKRQQVDMQEVIRIKTGKIDIDNTVNEYYQALLGLMKNKPELFS
jgi:putative hydrolase of HD superfamily